MVYAEEREVAVSHLPFLFRVHYIWKIIEPVVDGREQAGMDNSCWGSMCSYPLIAAWVPPATQVWTT